MSASAACRRSPGGAASLGRALRGVAIRWRAVAASLVVAPVLALAAAAAGAQGLPVPALDGRVIDRTGTLDTADREALSARLASLEGETGAQLVVLMVPATAPEDIAAYAHRVADQWKLGRREVGDGLLIVVAKDERKVRIEVAKSLEGAVPDLAARQVIDRAIRPAFRQGDYAGGLTAAVELLGARIRSEHLPAPSASPSDTGADEAAGGGGQAEDAWAFLLAVVPIGAIVLTGLFGRLRGSLLAGAGTGVLVGVSSGSLGWGLLAAVVATVLIGLANVIHAAQGVVGRRGYRQRGADAAGAVIGGWSTGHWTSGGGGWSSGDDGGGFSSGGGGDFGGGGASGDW